MEKFAINFEQQTRTTDIIFLTPDELITLYKKENYNKVFVIDKNVFALNEQLLQLITVNQPYYLFSATESNKSIATLQKLIDFFIEKKVARNTEIIAIGGGITLDTVGFAVSIYKRGCRLNFVPTTFVAMIDAAIGGKTGVNYAKYKNLIGGFYPAGKVLINKTFLQTLSQTDLMNGWAECIKTSLLTESNLYNKILENDFDITDDLIKESIEIKADYCRQDLTDSGVRKFLNLGHTYAHIIESVSDYEIPHGIAVALGIRAIALYSMQNGYIEREIYNKIIKPFDLLDFPPRLDKKYHYKLQEEGAKLLEMDKKFSQRGEIVIFTGFQQTEIITYHNANEFLNYLMSL
ncbi:MAG: 3-dehydroquinate synthase [Candidatus Cloacimonetes bacterium]|nr:3-dehydroquinate synthase [Candidatus Cloacimonadota bacterium]